LSEPGIARDERVKRGLSEFLYSATEVFRLKVPGATPGEVKAWMARPTDLGWAATDFDGKPWKPRSRGKPIVDGVGRPSIPAGITGLLVNDEESQIGKYLWSRLSAISHVTFFGLRAGMMLDDSTPSLAPDARTVPVGTDSSSVALQAFCIVRALRQAATARFALMGWEDDEWSTARDLAEQYELALFRTSQAGQPAATDEQALQEPPASQGPAGCRCPPGP
jgi:hypothetical protein